MKVVSEASDGGRPCRSRGGEAGCRRDGHFDAGDERAGGDARLKQKQPDVPIVTLTRHGDDAYVQELLRAGVVGLRAEAERAHRTAAGDPRRRGGRPVPRLRDYGARDGRMIGRAGTGAAAGGAERSRAEVLRLIAAGYSNKEIAGRLSLSVKTVEAHKANGMRKLGLTGRIDIMKYAVLQGWLEKT